MKNKLRIAIFFASCLFVLTGGSVQRRNVRVAEAANRARITRAPSTTGPRIEPSTVLESLIAEKKRDPDISAKKLADIGNQLIARQGYNFGFATCSIEKANPTTRGQVNPDRRFNVELTNSPGTTNLFQLAADAFEAAPCGCVFRFPLLRVGRDRITIVADGSPVKLVRPKDYYLDTIELVDHELEKVSRTWYNHSDSPPIGISRDGKRLYFRTGYDGLDIKELVVEIGEEEILRLVAADDTDFIRTFTDDFPKDPQNSYLGYRRFDDAGTSYIVKFSWPCT